MAWSRWWLAAVWTENDLEKVAKASTGAVIICRFRASETTRILHICLCKHKCLDCVYFEDSWGRMQDNYTMWEQTSCWWSCKASEKHFSNAWLWGFASYEYTSKIKYMTQPESVPLWKGQHHLLVVLIYVGGKHRAVTTHMETSRTNVTESASLWVNELFNVFLRLSGIVSQSYII